MVTILVLASSKGVVLVGTSSSEVKQSRDEPTPAPPKVVAQLSSMAMMPERTYLTQAAAALESQQRVMTPFGPNILTQL